MLLDLPVELKARNRGRRGGIRRRNKERKKERKEERKYLPAILTGNVQYLPNKIDELTACVR